MLAFIFPGSSKRYQLCNARLSFRRFTDGEESKSFSCDKGTSAWTPSKVVPDCVSEDTTLSTYDVEAKISYRGDDVIPQECLQYYMDYTTDFHQTVGQARIKNSDFFCKGEIFFKDETLGFHAD